ncbi:periplasmic copper-binding protein [Roseovarius sp. A-2]|uniref:copper-binding protein n=1 Tax=Roseovarius sp. A-2 TaxID=1570360 RepID=UPI0009CC4CD0|nr:copper-binding protein [Roseovarius sp. A-2]GAW37086.1 periplasmic copper-binding protein [Roseovarius sp. A-2]
MKPIRTALAAVFAVIFTVMGASAEPVYTKGVVKNVNPEDGKVTIIHEELVELEMPAMTMVFRVADDAMFDRLEPGKEIKFTVERLNGKLTVTDLK